MKFIDLTHKLENNIKPYPGDPDLNIEYIDSLNNNGECNLSKLTSSNHTGTHIDSPYHYFNNLDKIPDLELENLIGPCNILDASPVKGNDDINVNDIKNIPESLEKIVVLKTLWAKNFNSDKYFLNNPSLSIEFAKLFVENDVSLIATDMSSPDFYGETKIHKYLLKNNVLIIENLCNLDLLKKDKYYGYFIPLKINSEASLIRAFVRDI